MAVRLVLYADYVCPYCYVADAVVARLQRELAVTVETAALELRPPGTPLPTLDDPAKVDAWGRVVLPLAAEVGLELEYPRVAARTRKAHEAVAYARGHGAGRALHEALYRAYWQHGRDISRIDVLMEIGVEAGFDGTALKVALDIDQWTDAVERDEAAAARLGIAAVPAHVLVDAAGEPVGMRMGVRPYEELREWVMGNHDV